LANLTVVHGKWVNLDKPGGQVFFVSGGTPAYEGKGGSDGNSGLAPGQALSTIQAGLNKCVSGRGDTVAILPGSITVTAALTMTNDDVTLTGAAVVGRRERSPVIIVNATDVNTVAINANNCEVSGIQFDDNVATATADTAVIAVNTSNAGADYVGTKIKNCFLDMLGSDSDRDGIALGLAGDATDGAIGSLIEGCTILDCDQDAIAIAAGSEYSTVRDCAIIEVANGTRFGIDVAAVSCAIEDCDILVNGTACIQNGVAAARLTVTGCNLHAWGANTIGIVAIATATQRTSGNNVTATAAGNLVDYTTDNTTPSADAFLSNIFAADAGATALGESTVGGSDA